MLPFVAASVPMAYLGGLAPLSGRALEVILGTALLLGGLRLLLVVKPFKRGPRVYGAAYYAVAVGLGGVLGFLAGATGIGGGIFLSPVLIALGWASVREAASVSSAFIVLNSVAGLAAKLPATPLDLQVLPPLILVVVGGALLGSFLGASKLPSRYAQTSLGVVLLVAAARSLFLR